METLGVRFACEGTDKITSIRATSQNAEQVRQAVESYQAQLTKFQSQLDGREDAIKDGTDR